MPLAARMQKVADRLLIKYDERVTKIVLVQQSAKVWNATTAEYEFQSDVPVDVTGVAVPYIDSLVDGTTIQAGDIKLTITRAIKPTLKDKVILDGVEYSIVSVTPYQYTGAELNIAFAVQLRK